MKFFITCFLLLSTFNQLLIKAENLDSLMILYEKDRNNPELLNKIAKQNFFVSLDTAFYFSEKAIKIAQKQNNIKDHAFALHNIGVIYYYQNQMDSALEYYKKSIELNEKINNTKQIANSLNNIGILYENWGNNEKAIEYYKKSLYQKEKLNDKKGVGTALNNLGNVYITYGRYELALNNFFQAINNYREISDSSGIATAYQNIGIIYKQQGNYEDAIKYYLDALKIREAENDLYKSAIIYHNISGIYYEWKNFEEALKRNLKALELFEQTENKLGIAYQYNNIGLLYLESNDKFEDYIKSEDYLKKALQIFIDIQNTKGKAQVLGDLGKLYFKKENYKESTIFIQQARLIYRELNDQEGIINCLNSLGNNYEVTGKYSEAIKNYSSALEKAKAISNSTMVIHALTNLKNINTKLKNFQQALYYSDSLANFKDSIFNTELHDQIAELEMIYETEKKEKEIELLNKDKALQETEIKRQKLIRNFAFAGVIFLLILAITLYNRYIYKQKTNKLLREINDKISKQKDQIEIQKRNITDSIRYAQNIQEAVYPSLDYIKKVIPNHFIYYAPKDIVSGDFYWSTERQNKKYIAIADSTGHGVPGAFMSLLGISYLNEIMSKYFEISAEEILNELRAMIMGALKQQNEESKLKDGMDMAICIYDSISKTLEFSGANNPLYMVRENQLIEFKPDLMPVGLYLKMKNSFTKHLIEVQENDQFYLFTDGFVDQFGGNENKKFGSKAFKDLILTISNEDILKQKKLLSHKHNQWKSGAEQIDDILIMGFNFKK